MEQILKERGQFDLNIGFFDDLFNADELSCIDQPIAACAGIYDLDYYYYEAISHSKAYLPYTENDENQIIWMLDSKNELVSLSSCSQIVKALLKMKNPPNIKM